MLKLCQLIAARWLLWFTVRVLAVLLMAATPALTWPPVGSWFCELFMPLAPAGIAQAAIKYVAIRAGVLADFPPDLPLPLAVSVTAQ
jgi:hypothetical protein